MPNKNIPNNIEAEQAVIGSMFLSKYALDKACETLVKESFYNNNNAIIFETIKEMSENKKPIDLTTLTTELKNKNLINEIGGVEYLSEVLESVPTAANVEYYIKLVEDAAVLRRLIEVSTNITTNAYQSDGNVNETLDEAERKILSVIKNRRSTEFLSLIHI